MSAIAARLAEWLAPIALRVAAIALAVLALAAGWFYVKSLRAGLEAAQNMAQTAQETVGRRDAVITDLQRKEREHAAQLAQLEAKRRAIAAQLDQSERDFEALKNEKPDVRAWADSPLPVDLVRMYDRPAHTGAGAESIAPVRTRDTVHAAGDGATQ
jgi:LysB family phage lysis regulatory protein